MRIVSKLLIKIINKVLPPPEKMLRMYIKDGMICGENCRFFTRIPIGEPYLIQIKKNVTISTGVNLITHDNSAIKIYENATDFVGQIVIGNNCFIGSGSTILPGVILADNCIVAAGSVVTKSFLDKGSVIGGNPAKIIGSVEKIKEKNKEKVFNFTGHSSDEKKAMILGNKEKWIQK